MSSGDISFVKALLERGADLDEDERFETRLQVALRQSEWEIAGLLLDAGARFTQAGARELEWAAEQSGLVERLKEQGATAREKRTWEILWDGSAD